MNLENISISTDKTQLNPSLIHGFLTQSYWAAGIPYENVLRRIENSLCFGVYDGASQIGFARVITDHESFAYLADVFIIEAYRGHGLSKMLLETVLAYPNLATLRRFMLATRDAHGLYEQFDFQPLAHVDRWMERVNVNCYV
jgi:GNAT superfamily N-acetyltransferase